MQLSQTQSDEAEFEMTHLKRSMFAFSLPRTKNEQAHTMWIVYHYFPWFLEVLFKVCWESLNLCRSTVFPISPVCAAFWASSSVLSPNSLIFSWTMLTLEFIPFQVLLISIKTVVFPNISLGSIHVQLLVFPFGLCFTTFVLYLWVPLSTIP